MWLSTLKNLRWAVIVLGLSNAGVVLLGGFLVILDYRSCDWRHVFPFAAVSLTAGIRIVAMVPSGIAQEATAKTILESPAESSPAVLDAVIRHERRMRYKKWLWWTRFAMVITVLQFVGATYLVFHMTKHISHDGTSNDCVLGIVSNRSWWKQILLVLFMTMVCFVTLVQCFTGSDILKWRSYYATQDNAWKAHYREVFDNGMREALCCLGRVKYLSVLEEDEVYSVARLLGDLVAYRASGTGHLEILAGLALLRRHSQSSKSFEDSMEAPEEQIQEAAALHKFAEAAYTVGPLLDFGRNPFLFPCAWLYRQGVLTPWMRNRRPILGGDNWWRGHAAAFLKYVNLTPEVLRQGRVNQAKCEAAYFIVVLHQLRLVVIAVRGTETPEDLITDGLCKECILSSEDLDGLMNSSVHPDVKHSVDSSLPHYGHSGILEAARELFIQIDGNPGATESKSSGFLSSLLGAGCECDGYNVRIVGHSLGGAIAALLGIKLYRQYKNLRVYAYGPLPCVDSVVANACSEFVTSIVHNSEFSACLSVGSILRLRAAAITALSQDTKTDTAMIFRLARRFLYVSKYQRNRTEVEDAYSGTIMAEDLNYHNYGSQYQNDSQGSEGQDQGFSLWNEADKKDIVIEIDNHEFTIPFATNINTLDDPISQFMETVPRSENTSAGDPPEMFLPGLVIHIVPHQRSLHISLCEGCAVQEKTRSYKAYIANRESFKDIIVSPSMFLDHLPWRCNYAMQKVLEAQSAQDDEWNRASLHDTPRTTRVDTILR
ncbi:uncharacterized protein LOC133876341 isoform X2 [Alnus glutinosa]|uniref:uncharacterized protein LOC133876341 isoform X2 n=1 Tax=Alnus glutinosa TaxID=3517 RepID=UPI002D76BC25|nr:uncharacterized protein LOC133876341 isoform X2 [Alnus glutinosa]